jgi:hypothetical protein
MAEDQAVILPQSPGRAPTGTRPGPPLPAGAKLTALIPGNLLAELLTGSTSAGELALQAQINPFGAAITDGRRKAEITPNGGSRVTVVTSDCHQT